MTESSHNKVQLRQQAKAWLAGLSPAQHHQHSQALVQHLQALPPLQQAQRIAAYWPLPTEPQWQALLQHWPTKQWLLPRIQPNGALSWHAFNGNPISLEAHPRFEGLRQPPADSPMVAKPPEAVLVPCLGLDEQGYRLGHGGGFYDRQLLAWHQQYPALLSVGVLWQQQVHRQALPTEPWDRPLVAYATEAGVQWVGGFPTVG
jgi:5,10-methenyltetrahydrofolate synthetase